MESIYELVNSYIKNEKKQGRPLERLKRNDYCYCGKVVKKHLPLLNKSVFKRIKYKNCCMKKDNKNDRIINN